MKIEGGLDIMVKNNNGGELGFEEKLWAAADKLRNNMDPAVYKHVVLGLIFLKYISDSFEKKYKELEEIKYADPEDKDEYIADNIFWVPKEARWDQIKDNAKQPEIGQMIDQAMVAIEKENKELKGILNKDYSRPTLSNRIIGELIDLVSSIPNMADDERTEQDILGRVYEYFLGKFASAEGKGGGQFYTPTCIVKLLVEIIEPYKGRIFDPCCGSGGMFVQSEKFIDNHQGRLKDISVYGQESNPTTWRLCKMNLAIRCIENNLGGKSADSFHEDLHKDLRADYILANPPFNDSDWGGNRLTDDVRWKYGVPYDGNANYAWIQHFIHHLGPLGKAGFVLANGSLSTNQSNEKEIRKNILKADLVDCIVALPTKLFYNVRIPCSLWFIDKNKEKPRNRENEVLFIDARSKGKLLSRKLRVLRDKEDISDIKSIYYSWKKGENYKDIKGYCKSATLDEIEEHEYILTPGRYVGIKEKEEDDEPFDEKMGRLTDDLAEQFLKSSKLEEEIRENLRGIGYEF